MNGFKTTLILGAGATRGAIKGFNANGYRLNVPLNRDFLPIARKFVLVPKKKNLAAKLKRLVGFIYDELGWLKSETPTMEEIFSMAYTSKDFPDVYKGGGPGRKPATLKEVTDFLELLLAIFRTIDDCIIKQNERSNLYKDLAGLLDNGDTVITLNYDTLMDRELLLKGWRPESGYGDDFRHKLRGGKRRYYNGTILNNVKLLKLHGSFNWFIKKTKADSADVIFKKKPSRVICPSNMRWNEMRGYVRQIIPPLYGKFFSHTFWENLWTIAFKEIISSDRLIVIGCSLVDTDFHLRTFLGRTKVTKKNKEMKFKEIIVVDSDKKQRPQENFKRILRGCKRRFISMRTFKDFIKTEKGKGR